MSAALLVHFTGLAVGTWCSFFCIGIYFLYKVLYKVHLKKLNRRRFQKYVNWMLTGISVDAHKSKILRKYLLKSPKLCRKTNFNHIFLNYFYESMSHKSSLAFYSKLLCMEPCQKGTHSIDKLLHEPELMYDACKNTAYSFLGF